MVEDSPDAKFHALCHDGRFSIAANQLLLVSRPALAPMVPDPYVITVLAAGLGMDGLVNVRGGLLPVDQKIEMTPSGISVDAGMGTVTIQSLTEIKLSVAGGLSTITLGPDGVTIQGLLVKIN